MEFSLAFLAKCHECHKTMVNERDEQEDKVGNTADGHVSKHRHGISGAALVDLLKWIFTKILADIKIFVERRIYSPLPLPLCSGGLTSRQ